MKVFTLLLAGSLSVGSIQAQAAAHCEKQINEFLEIYSGNPRTAALAKPIGAHDFIKSRDLGAPSGNVPATADRNQAIVSKIEFKGVSTSPADMMSPVTISVSGYHRSVSDTSQSGLIGPYPALTLKLSKDCKLESFTVYDFLPQGGQKVSNEPVTVTGEDCLRMFSLSGKKNSDIWAEVKAKRNPSAPVADRIVSNCRHNSNASSDVKIAVPIMARLSGDIQELNKRFPPKNPPDNCASCTPTYRANN